MLLDCLMRLKFFRFPNREIKQLLFPVSSFQKLLLEQPRIVGVVVQFFLLLVFGDGSRMFGMLLLCCASSGLLRPATSLVHGVRLDDGPVAAVRPDAAYLADIGR